MDHYSTTKFGDGVRKQPLVVGNQCWVALIVFALRFCFSCLADVPWNDDPAHDRCLKCLLCNKWAQGECSHTAAGSNEHEKKLRNLQAELGALPRPATKSIGWSSLPGTMTTLNNTWSGSLGL